jgi:hypothetical protein
VLHEVGARAAVQPFDLDGVHPGQDIRARFAQHDRPDIVTLGQSRYQVPRITTDPTPS